VNEPKGYIFTGQAAGKKAVVRNAHTNLLHIATLFTLTTALMDDLEKLAEQGSLPNFVELAEVAERQFVESTVIKNELKKWHRLKVRRFLEPPLADPYGPRARLISGQVDATTLYDPPKARSCLIHGQTRLVDRQGPPP
jgi:hypothetical protein